MIYRTKPSKLVERESYLEEAVKNKMCFHVGAAQGGSESDNLLYSDVVSANSFLHRRLMNSASKVIGMDNRQIAIDRLNKEFGIDNIVYGDLQDNSPIEIQLNPDVVVMGEIMEHLSNPGLALNKLREVMSEDTKLIITIPNAFSLWNMIFTLTGQESHDSDHSGLYSPRITTSLLNKCGFQVEEYLFYHNTRYFSGFRNFYNQAFGLNPRKLLLFIIFNIALRFNSRLADGLIVCAKRTE
jgi:hypothetical protein